MLYTPGEAELLVRMPCGIARFEQKAQNSKYQEAELRNILEALCEKGLVFDIWLGDHYRYALAPMADNLREINTGLP